MPPKYFTFRLADDVVVSVYFSTKGREVTEFVAKLQFEHGGERMEVIRYDAAHGGPHKDVLRPDGRKDQVISLKYLDNNQALTFALDDLHEHWQCYMERYKQWLSESERRPST